MGQKKIYLKKNTEKKDGNNIKTVVQLTNIS